MAETGPVKSQDTPFEGGPMDGRVLPVLLGMTGHPPKTYRIPVPDPAGGPPTVLVYRRVPRGQSVGVPPRERSRAWGRLGLSQGWKYTYDPTGKGAGGGLKWPWSKQDPAGRPEDTDG
ncbi:hypothetical protein ACWDE0_09345 [Streptomyces sp. 900105755]|uniref:hypothetical protein n=1 Tax=Streptomyces sp. Ag109_O5-10 TaxID=1855349 RepID=UPI0015A674F6|nr:hypothetical protein [Streptomyces sp. Ag109_O5-10]